MTENPLTAIHNIDKSLYLQQQTVRICGTYSIKIRDTAKTKTLIIMNFKHLFFLMMTLVTFGLTSCGDDDDNNGGGIENLEAMPTNIQKAFKNKYPNAKADSWVKKDSYYIVNFTQTRALSIQGSAWFTADAVWKMTECDDDDINNLPSAVINTFKATEFADWKIDDIDIVERAHMQTIYVIEVERDKEEYELYFLEDGSLIKIVIDDDDDDEYLPEIPFSILEFLENNFKGFVLLDAEFDDGEYEIEFKLGHIEYEVKFDINFNWLSTECEIEYEDLPQIIRDCIEQHYPGWEVDEIEVKITSDGMIFEIELENGDDEIEIKINEFGEIIK